MTKQPSDEQAPGCVFLRGKSWKIVDVKWCRAEPDVGILSDYPDEFDLEDAEGNRWDWVNNPTTDEEDKAIDAALSTLTHEPDYDEPMEWV